MMGRDQQQQQQKLKQQQNHLEGTKDEEEECDAEDDVDERASEAGTYVVEGKKMSQSQMTASTISARRQKKR